MRREEEGRGEDERRDRHYSRRVRFRLAAEASLDGRIAGRIMWLSDVVAMAASKDLI